MDSNVTLAFIDVFMEPDLNQEAVKNGYKFITGVILKNLEPNYARLISLFVTRRLS